MSNYYYLLFTHIRYYIRDTQSDDLKPNNYFYTTNNYSNFIFILMFNIFITSLLVLGILLVNNLWVFMILGEFLTLYLVIQISTNKLILNYIITIFTVNFMGLVIIYYSNYTGLRIILIIKLSLWPIVKLFIALLPSLPPVVFIVFYVTKIPYFIIINFINVKLIFVLTTLSLITYSRMWRLMRSYTVLSSIVIINFRRDILIIYFVLRGIRMVLMVYSRISIGTVYNLIRLPFRPLFFMKVYFISSLSLDLVVMYLIIITLWRLNYLRLLALYSIDKIIFIFIALLSICLL